MRMQLVPLPRMKPRQPSSFHILTRALPTLSLYSSRPTLWIWKSIFSRSSGETTVRETAPATPPAKKDAKTGCARVLRRSETAGCKGFGGADCVSLRISDGMGVVCDQLAWALIVPHSDRAWRLLRQVFEVRRDRPVALTLRRLVANPLRAQWQDQPAPIVLDAQLWRMLPSLLTSTGRS